MTPTCEPRRPSTQSLDRMLRKRALRCDPTEGHAQDLGSPVMEYKPDQETEAESSGLVWMTVAIAVAIVFAAIVVWCSCAGEAIAAAPKWRTSLATQFGSKTIGNPATMGITFDKQAGAWFACGGKMDPLRRAVAHRTLPCGSLLEICKGKRCTTAVVWDRGPFHAVPINCGHKWSQRCWRQGKTIDRARLPADSMYRFANDLDLLPKVAWEIRLGGKAVVRWRVLSVPRRRK